MEVRLSSRGAPAVFQGSYLRLIDSCITQLKAQGPSRSCDESKEEEGWALGFRVQGFRGLEFRV